MSTRPMPGEYQRRIQQVRGTGVEALTPQERRVYELYGRGLAPKEIAREMGLAHTTVKIYTKLVRERLELRTGYALVAHAARNS